MLKDITIGQFFPGNSIIHRMDSRFKIVLSLIYVIMLFVAQNFYGIGLSGIFILMVFALTGVGFRMILKSLKPIIPIILFTAILNLIFVKGEGAPLLSFWIINVYMEGITTSLFMMSRIVFLIIGMSILTYTTSPIVLTDAIERLMSPLRKVKFPVHELAMMMTIALRFIPTLIEETDKIMMAQKARGANLDSGGIIKRAKSMIPILIPLTTSLLLNFQRIANPLKDSLFVQVRNIHMDCTIRIHVVHQWVKRDDPLAITFSTKLHICTECTLWDPDRFHSICEYVQILDLFLKFPILLHSGRCNIDRELIDVLEQMLFPIGEKSFRNSHCEVAIIAKIIIPDPKCASSTNLHRMSRFP